MAKAPERFIRESDNVIFIKPSEYLNDPMLTVPGVRLPREWDTLGDCYQIVDLIFVDGGDVMLRNKRCRILGRIAAMLFFESPSGHEAALDMDHCAIVRIIDEYCPVLERETLIHDKIEFDCGPGSSGSLGPHSVAVLSGSR
jgi:hypothetical protein